MIASEARGAWQDIERRLRPYVARRVASPGDVEDVLQEIFVRIHRGLSALRDGDSFGGWVYRIAQACIADAARARARSPLTRVDETPEMAAPAAEEADDLESELGACVALFVARLPPPYREAVTLTELEGLTQKAAAELLGITLPALKSRTLRGREKIRDMFEECCRISVDCRGRVTACEPRGLEVVPNGLRGGRARPDLSGPSLGPAPDTPAACSSTLELLPLHSAAGAALGSWSGTLRQHSAAAFCSPHLGPQPPPPTAAPDRSLCLGPQPPPPTAAPDRRPCLGPQPPPPTAASDRRP